MIRRDPSDDERLACPECSRSIWASDLCGCEDDDGPLCLSVCCPEWHRDDRLSA